MCGCRARILALGRHLCITENVFHKSGSISLQGFLWRVDIRLKVSKSERQNALLTDIHPIFISIQIIFCLGVTSPLGRLTGNNFGTSIINSSNGRPMTCDRIRSHREATLPTKLCYTHNFSKQKCPGSKLVFLYFNLPSE